MKSAGRRLALCCRLFLCICVGVWSASAPPAYAEGPFKILLEWRSGPGYIRQDIVNTLSSNHGEFSGPTSFRIDGKGRIYILDALDGEVEIFSPSGEHLKTYEYPKTTKTDQDTHAVDFAIGPRGELYLLEEASEKILRLSPEGEYEGTLPIPLATDTPHILVGVECDARGRLYVMDGIDNTVTRFEPGSLDADRAFCDEAMDLVMDRRGRFYGLDARKGPREG